MSEPRTGRSRRRTVVLAVAAVAGLAVLAAVAVGATVWWLAERGIEERRIEAIEERGDGAQEDTARELGRLNVLVVGNDSREELTEEQQRRLTTGGDQGPPRTDTILLVQLRPDREEAAVVSFPRDLLVDLPGRGRGRINAALAAGGPDALVRVVERLSGLEIDHYVEVSIPAFLTVVEAVGGVELCLGEPLVDPKSGADLPAGCQHLDPVEALAYVRSREGARADFRRIERQQRFLHALLEEALSARTFADVPRLLRVVDRVAGSVTTDAGLGLSQMRRLAQELRGIASGEVATATVPAYADGDGGAAYLVLYEPGADALFDRLAAGEPLGARGTFRQRLAADVRIWASAAPERARHLESVLFFLGFRPDLDGTGQLPAAERTQVLTRVDAPSEAATWVANILGAELREVDDPIELPAGAEAVVVAGSGPG